MLDKTVPENRGKNEKQIDKQGDDTINENQKVYTLEILRLTKDGQQQHGLRHGDYQRYRGYCSRRIRRLRKALKLPQGDKRHFKPRNVTIQHLTGKGADERFIYIPLMLAERAWAYAMQLRQEANTEPRKKFHLINKLRRACYYTLCLQELCNTEIFDARTKLEVEAYVAWMHGILHFELSLWKSAAENLKKAQLIYGNLARALAEDQQDLYKAKYDELTPNLRYCAYNIGDETAMDELLEMRAKGLLENIDVLVAQTKTESVESLQVTEWRGRKLTIRQEKVKLFLLSVREIDKSLEKAKTVDEKIQLIENLLMDCKDVISAVKDEVKQDAKLRSSTTGQAVPSIQYLLAFLTHIRLMRTIERNLYLIEQAKSNFDDPDQKLKTFDGKRVKPQDLTRFYEIILQNISEMQQIVGVEDEKQYQAELEVMSTCFKAFRCYYIALTLVELKRWKEAVAMFERSTKYAKDGLQVAPKQFNLENELKKLIDTIESRKFSAHAYSVLEHDLSSDSSVTRKLQKSNKPLYEQLDVYKEDLQLLLKNPTVFKMTDEMQPIPCKSLFFDLALNYVEFPSLSDQVENLNKKQTGISGFVKGFLGWGDKSDK